MTNNANSFSAYIALFKVTLRQMFWSRRTILILLGCLLTLVIALVFRFMARGAGSVNRFMPEMTLALYGLLTNLCAIFYGTAIISDEIEGKGLTYLQMRPLRKSAMLLSKFAAYLVGTVVLVAVSHLLLTGIVATHSKLQNGIFFHLGMSFRYSASLALGLLVYGALAIVLAVRFKNPVLWGLLFVLGWENLTVQPMMSMGIKRLSISHYLLTLYPDYKLSSEIIALRGSEPPSVWVALVVVCVLTVILLWLAVRIFREREYLM
ncbi:hypothetical protein C6495_12195 [Candidatus Poribacteria bacterium]|nr:MAG: hypothetical protein C6495_12195 [Candidatus Poribacteria bacterium]